MNQAWMSGLGERIFIWGAAGTGHYKSMPDN